MTISTGEYLNETIERESGGCVELSVAKIEAGPVVDIEAVRLSLVGWDGPGSRTVVPSGVRR